MKNKYVHKLFMLIDNLVILVIIGYLGDICTALEGSACNGLYIKFDFLVLYF